MSTKETNESLPASGTTYQIRLKGHIGGHWTEWLHGLTITPLPNGETLLVGPLVDQAALYGLLKKVRDLGIPLISVNPIPPDDVPINTNP